MAETETQQLQQEAVRIVIFRLLTIEVFPYLSEAFDAIYVGFKERNLTFGDATESGFDFFEVLFLCGSSFF